MEQIVVIEGEINLSQCIDGEMALTSQICGEIEKVIFVETTPKPHYHGATEFTPSNAYQTISTAGLIVDADIIIDPIPSNYGLVTWNGSVLTVS